MFEEEILHNKLYSWIKGLINTYDGPTRREDIPIWDLIREAINKGDGEIYSAVNLIGEEFEITIKLVNKGTPKNAVAAVDDDPMENLNLNKSTIGNSTN